MSENGNGLVALEALLELPAEELGKQLRMAESRVASLRVLHKAALAREKAQQPKPKRGRKKKEEATLPGV